MNSTGKGFESLTGVKLINFNRELWVNNGGVLTETKIDDFTLLGQSLFNKGPDKVSVIIDTVDFPDDIVAET
jgi:hypothetical protein